jgi:hypothetical protein
VGSRTGIKLRKYENYFEDLSDNKRLHWISFRLAGRGVSKFLMAAVLAA